MQFSNCCGAPIWQRDPITGHGHCNECGEPCTPENKEDMKETRTKRKELLLTPTEHTQMSAAAERAGLSLSAWLVMAAHIELKRRKHSNQDPDWWMKKLGV